MGQEAAQRPGQQTGLFDRLRFALEQWVVRGLRQRLLLAAGIVLGVAVIAGLLLAIVDRNAEVGESIWWAFLRLSDPGYLGDDEGVYRRTLSTIVTVLGYVLFLGLLVAILTQWMNQTLARLESGVTPVALRDHVVVLGWTQRTPVIVADLLRGKGRVQRFLASHGASDLRIAVLAEHVDACVHQELRERLGDLWDDRRVFLRAGSPMRADHLERVAFRDAAALILPGPDFGERNPGAVDAQTIRTLMALTEHTSDAGEERPLAVAELCEADRVGLAQGAYSGCCEVIATDLTVSRVLVQSVRQRGMRAVFHELMTLGRGNAIFLRSLPELAGHPFGELIAAFPKAVLLGRTRPGARTPELNPPHDTVVSEGDELVFLARSFEDCLPGEGAPELPTAARTPAPLPALNRRVLILGWSRLVPTLLEELGRHADGAFEVDVCSMTPIAQRQAALAHHPWASDSGHVRHVESGYTHSAFVEEVEPQRYDDILVLASERLECEEEADATSALACLQLRGRLAGDGPRPEILVELLDEENAFLFHPEQEDVLVSPKMVSYLLTQTALRRELAGVFAELTRPAGAQIVLRPARQLHPEPGPVRFARLQEAAARCGEIAVGIHGDSSGLALNPDRETDWLLGKGDEVVVLTTLPGPG